VAAKSIGSIAYRNRVRRRWREALRLCEESIPGGIDFVMLIKPAGAKIPGSQALDKIREALRQLTI
jgi:ribonuclease P protein component